MAKKRVKEEEPEQEQRPFADRFPTRQSRTLEFLAENVRELREAYGMSQAFLADTVAVRQAEISKIENRRSNPTILTLERIADAFAVAVPDMLRPGAAKKRKT